jgi:hypothetical protein
MALVSANVSILDDTKVAWRPMLERQLLTILETRLERWRKVVAAGA